MFSLVGGVALGAILIVVVVLMFVILSFTALWNMF